MTEQPEDPALSGDYNEAGVPSFDYVRDKIEGRVATSVGETELAEPAATSLDEQMAERDRAGKDKLEQIRKAMRGE
jgi:phage shock protein A